MIYLVVNSWLDVFNSIITWLNELLSELAHFFLKSVHLSNDWLLSSTLAMAGWSWLVFIVVGLSLLFTAYYFRRQAKQLNHALASLYAINDTIKQDALDFFEQAWPILNSVGCERLQAQVKWFGETKSLQKGSINTKAKKKAYIVKRDDMRFYIIIFFSRDAMQQQSVASLVVKTFLHIIEQDLVVKQSQILTSQKRLQRYQMFVQHEIKNMAQFIQMLAEQVTTINEPIAKQKLVDRLGATMPLMAQRARRTINYMQKPHEEFYPGESFAIETVLQNLTALYGLNAKIKGQAKINLPKEALQEILKNVLGNYRDHATHQTPMQITITHNKLPGLVSLQILSKQPPGQNFKPERMFEPFWTTSDSGLGLGLFLAREILKQFNGTIEFIQREQDNIFGFKISLPNELNRR